MTYKGKDIDDMTKEELIMAIKEMVKCYENRLSELMERVK
jgi:DNA-binding transcriptional regulator YbjK